MNFFRHPQPIMYPVYPLRDGMDFQFEGYRQPNESIMARQGAINLEEIIKNKVANFRRWKQTKLCRRHQKWAFQFSIMTYNILSQIAVENHRYLYRHCSNTFLQEDYRISKILPEILNSKSDIICLQEVEQHLFNNRIKKVFQYKGFEAIFKKRTGDKSDGCAILWRRKKFNLLRLCEVEFLANGNELLNRDNIGLIAVLKPNHPDSRNTQLHVATTHLIFNPRRGDVKLCQLRYFLAELERMALKEITEEDRVYHPTILCGDFNIEPYSPLYHFIESGSIDIDGCLSGDLSGQAEGRNKGKPVTHSQMSLHRLGISDSSRYEGSLEKSNDPSGSNNSAENLRYLAGSVDPSLIPAIGASNDPRWMQTLMAIGREQLTATIISHSQKKPNVGKRDETNPSDSSGNKTCFTHDFKFVPVYKFQNFDQKDMPITSMTGHEFNTVDHIFYNVQSKQNSTTFTKGPLKLLTFYSLMRKEEIKDIGGLPNAHLGSDHLSLIANFGLTFKR